MAIRPHSRAHGPGRDLAFVALPRLFPGQRRSDRPRAEGHASRAKGRESNAGGGLCHLLARLDAWGHFHRGRSACARTGLSERRDSEPRRHARRVYGRQTVGPLFRSPGHDRLRLAAVQFLGDPARQAGPLGSGPRGFQRPQYKSRGLGPEESVCRNRRPRYGDVDRGGIQSTSATSWRQLDDRMLFDQLENERRGEENARNGSTMRSGVSRTPSAPRLRRRTPSAGPSAR